jgi:hypothetical protein
MACSNPWRISSYGLHGCKPLTVVQAAMAALAVAGLKANQNAAFPAKLPDRRMNSAPFIRKY